MNTFSGQARPTVLRFAGRARRAGRDWLDSEGPRWMFVVKTVLAAFLALWIAFRLGFDSPRSAMMTVFIVALPSSGMALEKSVYRLLGTLIGCVAALCFIGLFPQQAMLLFIALALWSGLCTAGSAMMRNARSYGFVLAGYTACMIALPALSQPLSAFDLAVSRVTEISVGILCSAFVNDVLFPRHQSEQLVQKIRGLYLSFATLCREAMLHQLAESELERRHLSFATEVAALESQRAASVFEAGDIRIRSRQLHAFSVAAMATLTTFHTLHQLMERLRRAGGATIPALMQPLFDEFSGAMLVGEGPARTAAEAAQTRAEFEALTKRLPELIESVRLHASNLDEAHKLDLETALELLQRLAGECRSLVAIYASLPTYRGQADEDSSALPPAYSPITPPSIVLAAGLRNAFALLILAAAWYALNWPSAAGAVMIATVFCGLASSSPVPDKVIRSTTLGFTLATPFAFFCAFFMLNRVEGYDMLMLSMLPFIAFGAYVATWPAYAGIGVGFNLMFAQMVAPENLMRFNAINFINDSAAQIIGLLIAGLMFALILPEHRQGSRRHVRQALWHEAALACITSSQHLRHVFENRMRDLLNQLGGGSPVLDSATRGVVNEAMVLLELGHAAISLRHSLAARSEAVPQVQLGIDALAHYFRHPDTDTRQSAIVAADDAMAACRTLGASELMTDLHLIHTCLLDPAFESADRAQIEETDHAA